jgi:hypothetical protein
MSLKSINILFCGDCVARSGREALKAHIPALRRELKADVVIANVENAAHGFGVNKKIIEEFESCGIDIFTTGNHAFDQKDSLPLYQNHRHLVRPVNYPEGTPGKGVCFYRLPNGRDIMVINVMGRLFMDPLDDGFRCVDGWLKKYPMGGQIAATVVDIHAEATSEKLAMGYFCDGRVSLVVGTHTHVPTDDARILPKQTGYMSDAGMCGDYNSVCGFDPQTPIHRFLKTIPSPGRLQPAEGEGTVRGVFIKIDASSGKCIHIQPISRGGCLIQRSSLDQASL